MPQNKRPLIIGITGNIGSGKSAVCKLIEDAGYWVVYADVLANQRLEDASIITALVDHFGSEVLVTGTNDKINRKELSIRAFSSKDQTRFLNSLMHPPVLQDMQEIVECADEPVIFFEVPLLFEASLQLCFDFVVLICAPAEIRLARLEALRQNTVCIKERMANQGDSKVYSALADKVIDNKGSLEDLQVEVTGFLLEIDKISKRRVVPFNSIL